MSASPKLPPFDPGDPLGIDDLLSPEDRAVRDTVRGWAADRVLPGVAEWYEAGELPGIRELARELGGLGALGMPLSGYGCAGASAVQYGLACLELEAADSGIRSLVSVQGSLAMYAIHRFGSEEQKQHWLPRMASGEVIGCFGLTEPDHGSDPAAMRTHARRDAGGTSRSSAAGSGQDWVLTGRKTWITNGSVAGVAVVWASTDDGPRVHGTRDQAQVVTARLGHQRTRPRRGTAAGRRGAPARHRSARAPQLSQPRPLRHRLGSDGCRADLLADRGRLREEP
jgi:glutaryl-CoA dehydrogenase